MSAIARLALALAPLLALPGGGGAQSLLDRPPNLSGNWTGAPGTLHFNFVHRFSASDGAERKVSGVPTFLVAAGLPAHLLAGLAYSTNSALVAGVPNEWELLARWAPLAQDRGAWADVGGQLAYNDATRGADVELSAARRHGPLRLLVAGRSLSDPGDDLGRRLAVAAGGTLRLGTYVALAGDAALLADREPGERAAWSAGVHVALPRTPHTLSLQATNAPVTTLQGASRGTAEVRYGFEFTVPLTLRRYVGAAAPPPAVAAADAPAPQPATPRATQRASQPAGPVVRVSIRNLAYARPRLEVATGTTVEWVNEDPLAHTVTAPDRAFDSGPIEPGKSFRHTFAKAGSYDYLCTPHPFMKGAVVVRDP